MDQLPGSKHLNILRRKSQSMLHPFKMTNVVTMLPVFFKTQRAIRRCISLANSDNAFPSTSSGRISSIASTKRRYSRILGGTCSVHAVRMRWSICFRFWKLKTYLSISTLTMMVKLNNTCLNYNGLMYSPTPVRVHRTGEMSTQC